LLLVVSTLALRAFGNPASKPDLQKQREAAELAEKAAFAIVEQALSAAKNLRLPQNRIAVETECLQLLWGPDKSRAIGLLNQIATEFAQVSSEGPGTFASSNRLNSLRQQRQQLVQFLGAVEPQMALEFLATTRPYVRMEPPEQEEAEERQIQLNLASQEAARDPRLALNIAEKRLDESDHIPFELLNILNVLASKDRGAETKLLREIVSRLDHGDLASDPQDLNFALNLLNSRSTNPGDQNASQNARDSDAEVAALSSLAESLAAAVLSPEFPNDQIGNVETSLPALESLAPGQALSLRQKFAQYRQTMNPAQRSWGDFNQAQQGGGAEQQLAIAQHAPKEIRDSMYQQIAWNLTNAGDFARSRRVAEEKISDPGLRSQILQQGLKQASSAALQKGQLDLARQLIEQLPPEQARATSLIQLATEAANASKGEFALELLAEAESLLGGRSQNAEEFGWQMQLVQAYTRWKPAHAVQLLDRSAKQVNEVLAAAAQVDGFVPTQLCFEQGELVLSNSYLMNSLIGQYAQAAASLADYDLQTARTMANRISRPEARLMVEIAVARSVLSKNIPDRPETLATGE
jgi:hypothetical protein